MVKFLRIDVAVLSSGHNCSFHLELRIFLIAICSIVLFMATWFCYIIYPSTLFELSARKYDNKSAINQILFFRHILSSHIHIHLVEHYSSNQEAASHNFHPKTIFHRLNSHHPHHHYYYSSPHPSPSPSPVVPAPSPPPHHPSNLPSKPSSLSAAKTSD